MKNKANIVKSIFGRTIDTHPESTSTLDESLTDERYSLLMQELGFEDGEFSEMQDLAFLQFVAESCIESAVRTVINDQPSFSQRFSDLLWLYDAKSDTGITVSKAAAWINSTQEAILNSINANKAFRDAKNALIEEFNKRAEKVGIKITENNLYLGHI